MVVIRAHFDGKVIVPDHPLDLAPQSQVVVLVDVDDPSSGANLDKATRAYYTNQPPAEQAEDVEWGQASAGDGAKAWDDE